MKKTITHFTLLLGFCFILIAGKSNAQVCGLNATFSFTQGTNGQVGFNSTSTGTVAGSTYTWSYGDATANGSGITTSHTYTSNGTYYAVLYASNNFSSTCQDSVMLPIVVNSVSSCPLNAGFTYTLLPNGVVNFNSTTTGTTSGTTYSLNFGDNFSSLSPNIIHTYLNGTYTVTLTASNSSACVSTATQVITVTSYTCNIISMSNFTNSAGTYTFYSASTGTTASSTYTWVFDNATTLNGASVVVTYTTNGVHTIVLKASNNSTPTCVSSSTLLIGVLNLGCNLVANYTHTVSAGGAVNFQSTATNTTINSNMNYLWDFGDGFTSTLQSPSHTYSSAGAYNVQLITSDLSTNCHDTIIQSVNVTGIPCAANSNFTMAPTTTTLVWNAQPVSPGNVTAAIWNWGDNSTSNSLYTSHTYSAAGTYSICLSVTVSCGDTSSTCINQFVYKTTDNQSAQIIHVNVVPPSVPLGIMNTTIETLDWLIYPNPNNGKFEIKMNSEITEIVKIKIYNLIGEMVYETEVTNESITRKINLDNISNGVYFIKLNSNNKEYTKKIIVNK